MYFEKHQYNKGTQRLLKIQCDFKEDNINP